MHVHLYSCTLTPLYASLDHTYMGSIWSKAARRCPKDAGSVIHRPSRRGGAMDYQPRTSPVPEMDPDLLRQLKEMGPLKTKPLELDGVPQSILRGDASELGNSKNLSSEGKMGPPQLPKNRSEYK